MNDFSNSRIILEWVFLDWLYLFIQVIVNEIGKYLSYQDKRHLALMP